MFKISVYSIAFFFFFFLKTEIVSFLPDLHFTHPALFWLSGHQPSLDSLDFAASLSLSFTHTHICMGVYGGGRVVEGWTRNAKTHAVLAGAPHSSASGSFWLASACRLEDGGCEGGLTEKRVARQNGWSHEQRSVYKPEAEQQERGARERKEEGGKGKLQAPLWTEKKREQRGGEVCHDKASWRCERLTNTLRLCLRFFFSSLRLFLIEGADG